MTANMRTAAGAMAAIVLVAAAAMLTLGQRHGGGAAAPGASSLSNAAPAAGSAPTSAAPKTAPPATHASAVKSSAAPHKTGDKPLWHALTPAQQHALQPLQEEWDEIDGLRKQKWLQLANRFAALPPEEQQRVQQRMREWARLTPAQRELARETYNRARKIAPADKAATWESYQQLPEEQKRKLAATAPRKAPAVVPSQANGKVVSPMGAASCPAGMVKNPVSATPACVTAPASQTAPAPAPQPAKPQATPNQPDQQVPANWGITPNDA
jgi:hypothetical protein